MKKIITAVAILMVLHVAALGVLSLVYPVRYRLDRTYGAEPDVEYFEFTTEGGFSGGFQYTAKVYQDAMGYHLYYKDRNNYERTFTLTKLEYLQATAISQDDIDALMSFKERQIYDAYRTTVKIKFKDKEELEIPEKIYDASRYNYPMQNVLQIVTIKKEGQDNDHMARINKRLYSYYLKNPADNYVLIYSRRTYKRGDWDSRMFFSKGLLTANQELIDFETDAKKNYKTDSTVINYDGRRAFVKAKLVNGKVCIYITLAKSGSKYYDDIVLYSPLPEGISFEEYKQEVCGILLSTSNESIRNKAVLIETAVFFAAAFVTAGIAAAAGKKKTKTGTGTPGQ